MGVPVPNKQLKTRLPTHRYHDFDACNNANRVTLSLCVTVTWRQPSHCRAGREAKRKNKLKVLLSATTSAFARVSPLNTACKCPHTYNTVAARKLQSQKYSAAGQAACQRQHTEAVMFYTVTQTRSPLKNPRKTYMITTYKNKNKYIEKFSILETSI